ncbi:hypothetical protein ACFE04_012290 [Oxalis oulophora]
MAILHEKQQLTVLIPFYHLSYTVQPQRPYAVMLICLLEIFVFGFGFSTNPSHGFHPPTHNSTEFHLGGSIDDEHYRSSRKPLALLETMDPWSPTDHIRRAFNLFPNSSIDSWLNMFQAEFLFIASFLSFKAL